MARSIPLGWLQLKRQPARLAVALAGVAFAVLLVFMQLGFRDALYDSAVRFHQQLRADLILIGPRSLFLAGMRSFSRRRLYQTLAHADVEDVAALYTGAGSWKNPQTGKMRNIFIGGFDPSREVLDLQDVNAMRMLIRRPDVVLFDRGSRPEFGPIPELFESSERFETEVSDRRVQVAGLFRIGTSFGVDGILLTSDLNFLRLNPNRRKGLIEIGLIRLRDGADAERVRAELEATLPRDVKVLTKKGFMDHENEYWAATTPIGFVFTFGAIMGLVVGSVIVYQILYADIAAHLPEYATLKAMGYTNKYLFWVVMQEASVLALFGYLPGICVSLLLYYVSGRATGLPFSLDWERALQVLSLTLAMCIVSGAIALRKLRSVDPAEVF